MKDPLHFKKLSHWIEACQSNGKLTFGLPELRQSFKNTSKSALIQSLERLAAANKVVSVFKGFYIIIPPQYMSKGILPPSMFVDQLMKHLERKYYSGLLSAAAFHHAAHQQPQEFFVITEYPVLRATKKKGVIINYISTKRFPPEELIEKKKTETGYINISNPILTAIDLVNYEKRIGGLSRATTVIQELTETLKQNDVKKDLINYANTTSLQRLGYIVEEILYKKELADRIYTHCQKAGKKFYLIPLKASGSIGRKLVNEKWKVIINTEIEIDL